MNRKLTEQDLLKRLEALPREISPEKDAWPAIEQKIGAQSATYRQYSSNRWWFRAAAACVAVAFAAGILLGRQWDTAPRLPQPESRLSSQAYAPQAEGLAGVLAASELEYQAAFREFVSVGESREYLQPQTVEKLDAGWQDLREAEAAMSKALRQNPGNAFLSAKLLELRSRQIDFLKQIAALDQNNRRNTI
jgi:hypothetical protein